MADQPISVSENRRKPIPIRSTLTTEDADLSLC